MNNKPFIPVKPWTSISLFKLPIHTPNEFNLKSYVHFHTIPTLPSFLSLRSIDLLLPMRMSIHIHINISLHIDINIIRWRFKGINSNKLQLCFSSTKAIPFLITKVNEKIISYLKCLSNILLLIINDQSSL